MYGEWFPNSGLEIDESRNTFEVYLNDCSQVSEAELLTELHIPVK
jgi:DNA gyrase inhibitor GyrI